MTIKFRDWLFALTVGIGVNAGVILLLALLFGSDLNDLERAAGPSIQVTDAQGLFSDVEGESPEEISEQELVEDIDPIEPPVEVAEVKPIQEVSEEPVNEALAVLPEEKKPEKVKKPEPKPKPVKKPQKKKTEKKKKNKKAQKKRNKQKKGSKPSSSSNKGKQKKVSGKAAKSRYKGRVRARLQNRIRRSGKKGRVSVTFTLNKSGRVSNIRASGNPALVRLVKSAVRSASPFPPLPPGVGPRDYTPTLGFVFK